MRAAMFRRHSELSPLRAVVAAATVLAAAADLLVDHTAVQRALGFVLVLVLGQITITDLESRRIPNAVVGPASLIALVIGLVVHPAGVPGQLVAGVATGAFLIVFAVMSRGGLGMGDVKLGFVLGLYLSRLVLVAMAVGLVASAVFSLGVLVRHGFASGLKVKIPLGPFLALGGVVAVLAGPLLARHWGAL